MLTVTGTVVVISSGVRSTTSCWQCYVCYVRYRLTDERVGLVGYANCGWVLSPFPFIELPKEETQTKNLYSSEKFVVMSTVVVMSSVGTGSFLVVSVVDGLVLVLLLLVLGNGVDDKDQINVGDIIIRMSTGVASMVDDKGMSISFDGQLSFMPDKCFDNVSAQGLDGIITLSISVDVVEEYFNSGAIMGIGTSIVEVKDGYFVAYAFVIRIMGMVIMSSDGILPISKDGARQVLHGCMSMSKDNNELFAKNTGSLDGLKYETIRGEFISKDGKAACEGIVLGETQGQKRQVISIVE